MISKSSKKISFRVGGDRHLLKRGNEVAFIKQYFNATDWLARQVVKKALDKYTAKKDTVFCGELFAKGEAFYLPSDIAQKMQQLIDRNP